MLSKDDQNIFWITNDEKANFPIQQIDIKMNENHQTVVTNLQMDGINNMDEDLFEVWHKIAERVENFISNNHKFNFFCSFQINLDEHCDRISFSEDNRKESVFNQIITLVLSV